MFPTRVSQTSEVAVRVLAVVAMLVLMPVLAACHSDIVFNVHLSTGQLTVRTAGSTLILRNATGAPVHYVALEEKTSAVVDLHYDPTQWPQVRPGEDAAIRYRDLTGYQPGARQARVHWWTKADGFGHLTVDL